MNGSERIRGILKTRKAGEYTYEYYPYYFLDIQVNTYSFEIWDEKDDVPNKYSLILEIMDNGIDLKVMDMFAGDYKGRGISIPAVLKAKELFGKRITSSSNAHSSRLGEANWELAIEKVWDPMVTQGLAVYSEVEYRYYVL